jgi:1-aminocyclopropane-1-carboxylate deaminase/D-cysteine desulfhydrase-like pyridoxal-dependent ACC family enzyme
MSTNALDRLRTFPRMELAHLPTPLLPARNLQRSLGTNAPEIFLKMDGWTGFAMGGNKVRKLEFVLANEGEGSDTLVTCGGPQSNHARATAGAAAYLGMECVLVLNGEAPRPYRGNALLQRLYGARIHTVEGREERAPAMEKVAEELEALGRRPLVVPLGASTPMGALGYTRAAVEVDEQLEGVRGRTPERPGDNEEGPDRTWVFVSASSCGTLAGLALGFTLLGRDEHRIVGISADVAEEDVVRNTTEIAAGAGEILRWEGSLLPDLVHPDAGYVGEGYGIPTDASQEAGEIFAREAGVVLDPVYTAKVGAGLLDWIRKGRIPKGDRVIFWHTGGEPGLFA